MPAVPSNSVRANPESIEKSVTLSGSFARPFVLRGCAASQRPPATVCNPYRDLSDPRLPRHLHDRKIVFDREIEIFAL